MSSRLLIMLLAAVAIFGLSVAFKLALPPIDFIKVGDRWYVPEKAPEPRKLLSIRCNVYNERPTCWVGWLDERGIINPGIHNKSVSMLTVDELERLWLDCTPGIYRIEHVYTK